MYYKIVAINSSCPEHPTVYTGKIPEQAEYPQHPIIRALSTEFGDPATEEDRTGLASWSAGEVLYWTDDLKEIPDVEEFQLLNDDSTFYVFVDSEPYAAA